MTVFCQCKVTENVSYSKERQVNTQLMSPKFSYRHLVSYCPWRAAGATGPWKDSTAALDLCHSVLMCHLRGPYRGVQTPVCSRNVRCCSIPTLLYVIIPLASKLCLMSFIKSFRICSLFFGITLITFLKMKHILRYDEVYIFHRFGSGGKLFFSSDLKKRKVLPKHEV